jgi:hypothetical protein
MYRPCGIDRELWRLDLHGRKLTGNDLPVLCVNIGAPGRVI